MARADGIDSAQIGFAFTAALAASICCASGACRTVREGATSQPSSPSSSSPSSSSAASAAVHAGSPPDPLRSPFDVEARRALVGKALPEPTAPPLPQPVLDVIGVSFYVDEAKSVVDPALKEQNLAALKPLRTFVGAIVKLADGWMLSRPPRPAYAAMALEALGSWARANALLGEVNRQGEYEREWTLGSLALAYLKIRDAPAADPASPATRATRTTIETWLRKLALLVQPNYERPQLKSSRNNHAYWTGLAVAATGVACNDRGLFDWGLARARIGIAQVQADGVLPLERDRRALALHYHVFALAPLVLLAELAVANGIPLYDESNGAIRRLANLVIEGLADPAAFAARAGVSQEITLPPGKTDLAWAEPYYARFPDRRLAPWIASARPLFDVRLGGDMTAAFGVPQP